jgi:putative SOS response-associated peptidase YedK
MCGRYAVAATVEQIVARFNANPAPEGQEWAPRYNVAPSQANPVVVRDDDTRLAFMQWGLVPAWSKEPKTSYSTINARVETVADKATYRTPLRRQRCLVPATGYYEWQAPGDGQGVKQPYHIQPVGGDGADALFAFAGLYDIWRGPNGQNLATYTILTTAADPLLAPIHARMPIILPRDAEAAWLDPRLTDPAAALALLTPAAADRWRVYPVSTAVNSPSYDNPELVRAVG